ncbi:MAG TPA: cytochrome P450 [Streptosporangiaceae bacterium]|nr:cytochrome P450 [Streptosporangiaceae bacterium]
MSTIERPALADLGNPAVLPDPYPVLAGLRSASPFPEFDGAFVVVGRHADCSAVLRDPRASSQRDKSLTAQHAPRRRRERPSFLSLDPPDHTRLRRLVSKAFTARTIARLEPRIRAVTGELLGAATAAGQLEVVSQLAYPLPVRIISEMLGVPVEDHPRFAGWSARLANSLQPGFGIDGAEAQARAAAAEVASDEFADYFRELIALRRAHPTEDLLSEMISAEDAGQKLTEDELIATCILLLVAGHETTVGLISNAILALLRHPSQLALLQDDLSLAAGAVEETLRYDAPVQMTGRVARDGMRIGNLAVRDGALILLLLAATGRDPDVFADPDRFDIRRGAANHLAFAAGPHFCLGAPLARLEAAIALQEFAARLTAPQLDEGALRYKPNLNLRGPDQLVVHFTGAGSR